MIIVKYIDCFDLGEWLNCWIYNPYFAHSVFMFVCALTFRNIHINLLFVTDVFFIKDKLSGLRQLLASESPVKLKKNAFHFTLKVLFVLKTFKFLSRLFGCVENDLIRKIRLTSKFMFHNLVNKQLQCTHWPLSQEVKAIRQLNLDINWILMKLIEYNMRKFFFRKIIHKMRWRTYSQTLVWKIKIEHISGSIVLKFCTVCFYCMQK